MITSLKAKACMGAIAIQMMFISNDTHLVTDYNYSNMWDVTFIKPDETEGLSESGNSLTSPGS